MFDFLGDFLHFFKRLFYFAAKTRIPEADKTPACGLLAE